MAGPVMSDSTPNAKSLPKTHPKGGAAAQSRRRLPSQEPSRTYKRRGLQVGHTSWSTAWNFASMVSNCLAYSGIGLFGVGSSAACPISCDGTVRLPVGFLVGPAAGYRSVL